jgi:hypothetical protein
MENNIIEFMEKVEILNKDISIYKNLEKGIIFPLNTVNLLTRLDYLEVGIEKDNKTKISEYEMLKFEKKIEDLEYKEIIKKKTRVKSDITGKREDKTTLIEDEIKAVAVWNVSNTLGAYKSFANKEEAIETVNKINEKILSKLK